MERELTPQERENIYLEEKSKREDDSGSSTELLLVFSVVAAAALATLYWIAKTPKEKKISIEDIRKAYSGLAPDDFID